jgi:hypothetical protein
VHGVDFTRFQTFAASPGHEIGVSTVRHHNSVFHDLLKRVPWDEFERLTTDHGADHRIRRLPTKSQFIALLYGQFSGADSLREIVGGLKSHAVRLYHVGGTTVSRSTLEGATNILSDRIGLLPQRQAKNRKNPFSDPVREVRVRIETGKVLRILCNDLDASAQKAVESPLAFARLVRANLMHRKRIDRLIGDDPKPRIDPNQMMLQWA